MYTHTCTHTHSHTHTPWNTSFYSCLVLCTWCDLVRFQVLMATSMKIAVLWDVALCSLIEIDRHFRGAHSVSFYQTTQHNIPEDSHLHGVTHSIWVHVDYLSKTYLYCVKSCRQMWDFLQISRISYKIILLYLW
jgi:hypothetical protein